MHEPAPPASAALSPAPDDGPPALERSEVVDRAAAALRRGEDVEITGFLFDMDGTLVDSIEAVEQAWQIFAQEYGIPMMAAGAHGQRAISVIAASGVPEDQHEAAVARLTAIESRDGQTLQALPGIPELISALPLPRWGIVTSAARPVAHARFGATTLPEPLSFITGDDVASGKPDPEPFALGKRKLHARTGDAERPDAERHPVIALEDTTAGLASARAAGCLAIGVLGTDSADELAAHAHLLIPSAHALRVHTRDGRLLLRAEAMGDRA